MTQYGRLRGMSGSDTAFVGKGGTYTDPLWRITTELSDLELALLESRQLRRLHFVSHAGASRLVTHQTYSRLEHSLGVFSLVAYFCPEDALLRTAALLHDVGHLPFSHTLEGLVEGLNHHRLGNLRIGELSPTLAAGGVDVGALQRVLDSETILTSSPGNLNLDHLDSFVRSGRVHGWLDDQPEQLLDALRVAGTRVDAVDISVAATLLDLICREAVAHTSWANVAPVWALRTLVTLGLTSTQVQGLGEWTDDDLWSALGQAEATARAVECLRFAPQEIVVTSLGARQSKQANYSLRKLYLSLPLLRGEPLEVAAPKLLTTYNEMLSLPQHFVVSWPLLGKS